VLDSAAQVTSEYAVRFGGIGARQGTKTFILALPRDALRGRSAQAVAEEIRQEMLKRIQQKAPEGAVGYLGGADQGVAAATLDPTKFNLPAAIEANTRSGALLNELTVGLEKIRKTPGANLGAEELVAPHLEEVRWPGNPYVDDVPLEFATP
jgi:hypothetical protein